MAIRFDVVHLERLVVAVLWETQTPEDFARYLAELYRQSALSYRKLFDIRFVPAVPFEEGIASVGDQVMAYAKDRALGPIAIVADRSWLREAADRFAQHAKADRPLRWFWEAATARAWLDDVAPV
jgi:hypothetical protein